jgi:hypothetical protein
MAGKKNVHARRSEQIPLTKEQREYFGGLGAPWSASQDGVTFALVRNRSSDFQVIENMPRELLVDHILSLRDCREEKDGPGVIWADIANLRTNASVRAVTALSYDIDGAIQIENVSRLIGASGLDAVVHTTHSHMKTRSEISTSPFGGRVIIRNAELQQYLDETGKTYLGQVRLVTGQAEMSVEGRPVFVYEHDPEHKCRAIIFLRAPIDMALVGAAGFRALYRLGGERIFGPGNFDEACANPARVNYLASHPRGRPYITKRFPGDTLDWRPLWEEIRTLVEEQDERRQQRYAFFDTRGDLVVLRHTIAVIPAHDYFVWFRVLAALHHETAGGSDGLGLAHEWSSTAGNYDEAGVERLWSAFDPDHPNPLTLGYLINLARECDPTWRPLPNHRNAPFWKTL